MIITRRKRFFRGTLSNFCKIKKGILFNVDYRPGSKKSKFDTTLIRHSPFKIKREKILRISIFEGIIDINFNSEKLYYFC